MLYLKLADGRGWVFEAHDSLGVLCDRIEPACKEIEDMLHAVQRQETRRYSPYTGCHSRCVSYVSRHCRVEASTR